mmetsp:Transcript_7131/g.19167  ORF Transcript_7131/g.19167 Transcript_7131/m.19167 type:complete len:222 (+) Transcript_7131:2054-2719(+)
MAMLALDTPSHCSCVLMTSRGVVATAAVAPATAPSTNGWLAAFITPPCCCCSSAPLSLRSIASYTVNWMAISGTSRMRVTPKPTYMPRRPCARSTRPQLTAMLLGSMYAWMRCFSTSPGTRMKAEATAAAEEDTMWQAMPLLSHLKWCSIIRLQASLVAKNTAAAGRVVMTALVRPRYRSLMPLVAATMLLPLPFKLNAAPDLRLLLAPAAACCHSCNRGI